MEYAFIRGRRLHAAVILGVCFFALAALAGGAWATTTSSSSNATCTTVPGSCTFGNGTGSATFAGQFHTPLTVTDQSLCPAQAVDPFDEICGHFGLNFNNQTGSVTVAISFDPVNDLDLCVVNGTPPAATVVGCSTGMGATETVIFTVNCTDTHFEAQILPFSFPFPGPTPIDPATYTGTVSTTLTSCAGGNPPPPGGNPSNQSHKVTGGGQLTVATTADTNFSVQAFETDPVTHAAKGKVRIATYGCDFRGVVDSAIYDDTTQTAVIHGHSASDSNTTFDATAHDGGEGNSNPNDTFTINKCNGGGKVQNGNVQYHAA